MLPEPLPELAARLNAAIAPEDAQGALSAALGLGARIAVVSSFGADSAVLLHMAAQIDPGVPVLFIDTLMLFQETLDYQRELAAHLGLRDLRRITPDELSLRRADVWGDLHKRAPDACCDLRKTRPLAGALAGFDGWISGRKRHQSATRAALPLFEADPATGLKVNPLAHWPAARVSAWMAQHDLPRHPMFARGFSSLGCGPCTSPVAPGEDPRAGRWRDQDKVECGIHFVNGKAVRSAA